MFKWISQWFDETFPEQKPEPVVVEPVQELVVKKPVDVLDMQSEYKLHYNDEKHLFALKLFASTLMQDTIIGWHDIKAEEDRRKAERDKRRREGNLTDIDELFLSYGSMYTTVNDFYLFSDTHEYHIDKTDGRDYIHFRFSSHRIVKGKNQGDLFDADTVVIKGERIKVVGDTILYRTKRYRKIDDEECRKNAQFFEEATERVLQLALSMIEGVPHMEREGTSDVPFNKLWEQIELPLDTGTELVKL